QRTRRGCAELGGLERLLGSSVGTPVTTATRLVVPLLTNGCCPLSGGSNRVWESKQKVTPATLNVVHEPSVGATVTGFVTSVIAPRAWRELGNWLFECDGENSTWPVRCTTTRPRSMKAPPPLGRVSGSMPVAPSGVVNFKLMRPSGTPTS